MNIVYVIGYPGAGKTTTVTGALANYSSLHHGGPRVEGVPHDKPLAHVRYDDVWHIGAHRPIFGGTDTLSMSVNPTARQWVHDLARYATPDGCDPSPRVLIGEGDRLANGAFLDDAAQAARSSGGKLTIVHLDLDWRTARDRAEARAARAGTKPQSSSWWKGRVTKVNNLANSRKVEKQDVTTTLGDAIAYLTGLLTS